MSRGSSRRLIPEPKSVAMSGSLLARAGRGLDRGDDVLIARAAAQISLERVADLGLGRLGLRREQISRRHDHAGSAKAALQPVLLPKRLLQRVRSEEHTSELQSPCNLVCRLLLEKKKPCKQRLIAV